MINWALSKLILRNTKGEPSWSLTLAVTSFFVTTFLILFGGNTITIKKNKITIPKAESSWMAIYFPCSLGLYFGRRYTEASRDRNVHGGGVDNPDGYVPNSRVVTPKPYKGDYSSGLRPRVLSSNVKPEAEVQVG
jgi:hypothetical protein